MANAAPTTKRLQIDKANSTMVIVLGVAIFITFFSLISSKSLFNQLGYKNRVIDAKQQALNQLQTDVIASSQLTGSYKNFVDKPTNLIGGNSSGSGGSNGNNGEVVLDALPSEYDFPALVTSIQSLLSSQGVAIQSIGGTDTSGGASSATATTTTPVAAAPVGGATAIPLQFSVDGPYANIQNVVNTFEKSIRPFQFQTLQISGNESNMTLNASAETFYQTEKDFKITSKAVE